MPNSWSTKLRVSRSSQKQSLETPQVGDGLQKPTKAEYAKEAGKEFLNILEAVAQFIPLPGVGAAAKIAANILRACDESQATLETAEELKRRVRMILIVVFNEVKGKQPDEISDRIKRDIEDLQHELQYIENKLGEIVSKHALPLLFFRTLNEDKVRKCISRLDGLVERFNITQHINQAGLLGHLEKEIISFYHAQKQALDQIDQRVDSVKAKVETVIAILEADSSATGPSFKSGPRASVPTNKNLFYGRDALVLNLVTHLTNLPDSRKPRHICIFGPGGMGKTSTALTVMAHSDVKKHFAGAGAVWVPCVKATSFASFFDTLATSLGITQTKGDIKEITLSALRSSGPVVLLFDNFETPWNVNGGRSEVEQILREINQIPHASIFITMRSSAPPCSDIAWHSVNLKAVDAQAAQLIYATIFPDSNADPHVPELLELIGCMPLAITLMATSAKYSKLSAKHLIDQYKKTGTTMLSQGSDAEHSMDICISLSVDSPPMKRNPNAQWLLTALSMLPVGTTYDMLTTWWAPNLQNITGALHVLAETSLLEVRGSTYSVLPVIQRYTLDPARFDARVRDSMIESACKFLEQHKSFPGDDSYTENATSLAAEEGNLEAILLQTVAPSTIIMDGLLALAEYQTSARPRTQVIGHALALAQELGDDVIHAIVLWCYGRICFNLDLYEESRKHYTNARKLFLSANGLYGAARCLLGLVYSHQADISATTEYLMNQIVQAESELVSVGNTHGIAHCVFLRGNTASDLMQFDEALSLYHHARDMFTKLQDPLMSAECTLTIAKSYYHQEDFEQARIWSELAMQEFDRLGTSHAKLLAFLWAGCIYNALGQYTTALETISQCVQLAEVFNTPIIMGYALEVRGIASIQTGNREEAQTAFQEALEVSPPVKGGENHVRYRYWMKKANDPSVKPTSYEEQQALRHWFPKKTLDLFGVQWT